MVAEIIAATVAVVMVAEILNLTLLIQINLQEQKVGKIGVMEILLKIQNMKAVEAGEEEGYQMRVIHQTGRINIPFL